MGILLNLKDKNEFYHIRKKSPKSARALTQAKAKKAKFYLKIIIIAHFRLKISTKVFACQKTTLARV